MNKLREAALAALNQWDKVSGIFRMTAETEALRAALTQPEGNAVNESDIYVPYCLTEAEAEVSETCFDLSTAELLRELLIRLWNTNGVEFCPEDDLFSVYNEIKHELQQRGFTGF